MLGRKGPLPLAELTRRVVEDGELPGGTAWYALRRLALAGTLRGTTKTDRMIVSLR